ncbi:MAG: hypothetical protein AAF491_00435 [Verrucomicrobiota bacterium]
MSSQPIEFRSESLEPSEADNFPPHLETIDDIPREIADRRMHAEFGDHITPAVTETIRESPDHLESPEDFARSASKQGIENVEGVLGWSTRPEDPAHVLKGDVGQEIATLIHEDLHRATHPETLHETASHPELRELYEGITEHFTEQASEGIHGFRKGEAYPEQVESARRLAAEVGEEALRDWFFKHELTDELRQALERLS